MTAENRAIADDILALTRYVPRGTIQILNMLRASWGHLCERRLYRILKQLRLDGAIQQTSDGYRTIKP